MAEKGAPEPIIVKRVKKVVGGHGGGVWKIAYADFVTAMMAFFLLMWVLGSTTSGDLAGISAYFQNPLRLTLEGGQGSGDQNSVIKGGGPQIFRTMGSEAKADADTEQRRISDSRVEEHEYMSKRLWVYEEAKGTIQQALLSDPELSQTRNQVFMDVSAEGLRIQIVDDRKRPMFSVGGADMAAYARNLLRLIGSAIKDLPNMVRIEGHTDGLKYGNGPAGYSNWELSTERANAARRELVLGGLEEKRVSQVVGFADTIRLNPTNPNDPLNRRISITVQNAKVGDLPTAKPMGPSPAPKGLERPAAPAIAPNAPPPTKAPAPPANRAPTSVPSNTPPPAPAPAAAPPAEPGGRTPVLVLPPRPQFGPTPPAGAPNR
ncbi:MAG: flagellar motor protein MotB [Burkholderiaceae bacterium]